MGDNVYLFRI